MATTERDLNRETIRRTLAFHAGNADANGVAAATLIIWQQIVARLVPVIGARGVEVLFRRALHMTHSAFPCLAIAGGELKESAALLASLKECLAGREAAVAAEASYTLLETFTELLSNLIGTSLIDRLLGPVWAPSAPASKQEPAS